MPAGSRSIAGTGSSGPEDRLAKKGLLRQAGFYILADEFAFNRYTSTIERLRVSCYYAQKECEAARMKASAATQSQQAAFGARIQARNSMSYSETWREYWHNARMRNNATDALMIANLSKEEFQKWKKDAEADFHDAIDAFGGQCQRLRQMHDKLWEKYAKLAADGEVQHALAEVNNMGKAQYRLGPSSSAIAAAQRLQHEEEIHSQLKRN